MAEALNARASATVTRSSIVHADDGTVDGKAAVSAVLDLTQYGDVGGVTSGSVLARVTSGTGKAEIRPPSAVLDIIGATQGSLLYRGDSAWAARTPGAAGLPLVTKGASADPVFEALSLGALAQGGATNGQAIAWNGSAWAPATVGGGSADDWDIVSTADPASPYTASTLTGNSVVKITALAKNLTIEKPTGTFGASKRWFVVFDITASGADRTITWGTGVSLGLGVAPSLVIASGTTARFALYTDDNGSTFRYDGDFALATETLAGRIEVATLAEVNTGTDTGRAVAPDQLAGSYAGTKSAAMQFTSAVGDDHATGDGQAWFIVPANMNGMNLVSVLGVLATAGTTGTADFQIRRVRGGTAADMLSTKLTIDSTELTSATAAAAAVINTSNDDVATGDIIYLDIDAVQTTKAKGGGVVLEFRLP